MTPNSFFFFEYTIILNSVTPEAVILNAQLPCLTFFPIVLAAKQNYEIIRAQELKKTLNRAGLKRFPPQVTQVCQTTLFDT